jgi:Ca2+-transporting ATPase
MKQVKQNYNGLSEREAQRRLQTDGFNELPSSKPKTLFDLAFGVIREPMFILLVCCGALYLILGDITEGLLLLCFVFVIMAIEFFQERKTEKALDALRDLASPRALVIRDGIERRIAGRDVVKGDLMLLKEGDRVAADAVVINAVNLMANESILTGESAPVRKIEQTEMLENTRPGGDDLPFVYSGSLIVQGSGIAEVYATGSKTEIGKIGKSLLDVEETQTKLKTEMGALVKKLAFIGVALCLIVITVYTLTRGDLLKGFLAGISLAMAMLPEEFPVVLTVFLAVGAWRISKRNVLTRKPSAIETLGSATVLCTDKTGTLTQNKMTVIKLFNGKESLELEKNKQLPEEFHELIEYGILASQTNPFDPMEKAITALGDSQLQNTEHIHSDWDMLKEYPLSKEMLAMSRVFTNTGSKLRVIAAKGAPEAIFDLCHIDKNEIVRLNQVVEQLAADGLRVIGVAKAELSANELPPVQHDFDFQLIGLIGLADPIRPEAAQAVAECYKAGVRVIMITGDYPVTAKKIAREIGLKNYSEYLTGADLAVMSDEELSVKIRNINIFARVMPEQKLKIVNALKLNNDIVAMTGDGVNDAPALKAANIGIAMGEQGTDVARESASLVLLDDNFSSIVGAIRMGRRIFDNLRKALSYIFAIHVPIAGLSIIPVFFADLPLLLWPLHIVFLELIIDPACSIIFEAETEEQNIMKRPPGNLEEPFFGFKKILIGCLQGINVLIAVFAVYLLFLTSGYAENQVRTLSFITLIVSNIAIILSNRSWSKNIFKILKTRNATVKWIAGGATGFLALSVLVPFMRDLFKFGEVSFFNILVAIVIGFFSIAGFEIYKYFNIKNNIDEWKSLQQNG